MRTAIRGVLAAVSVLLGFAAGCGSDSGDGSSSGGGTAGQSAGGTGNSTSGGSGGAGGSTGGGSGGGSGGSSGAGVGGSDGGITRDAEREAGQCGPLSGGASSCDLCLEDNCCPVLEACAADTNCNGFVTCLQSGKDVPTCTTEVGAPGAAFTALGECVQANCNSECN